MYDIIGDIHGEVGTLERMLVTLGYQKGTDGYFHPKRKAIFVGDFVDRGPNIREGLRLVKEMVENGNAYAIVGNHELNVLAYYTKDEEGLFLRNHNLKNKTQIKRTFEEFKLDKEERKVYLKWLRSLPLFLEFDEFRVVHACWDDEAIDLIKRKNPEKCLSKEFLRKIFAEKGKLYKATLLLLKGREFLFPKDLFIKDSYGFKRNAYRIKWWDKMDGKTFQGIAFGNRFRLPEYTIPKELYCYVPVYGKDELPVFFGHFCLNDKAGVVEENLCCVDGCVANGGALVAYKWNGAPLSQDQVVRVSKNKKRAEV